MVHTNQKSVSEVREILADLLEAFFVEEGADPEEVITLLEHRTPGQKRGFLWALQGALNAAGLKARSESNNNPFEETEDLIIRYGLMTFYEAAQFNLSSFLTKS
ncbi:MAG: hypothetical protein A3A96_00695 [Candidatus Zambryskibacteria bacterium RIFCSPLOWO2_01_FULL_39_39]|uniref:Uncharacterized protein n=1 Tax=Candidatus Zambryskibacteria bacterium RIFCSPLOWO2_01_FULL_39_39 TaxID=1802758 RepID=A0A1G2TXH8_9BACT|nr:MAG: hypothetical protein UT00_C0004G0034 [Parcubacteria group bacterium GW2011_GWA1_38_7]OHA87774.1 MAG: hypothetical protein A2644_01200 [Candidatus Zambryskibacteria bacterium RIFCSPHIGHO2_01_FULL_39_63]OHA95001.1 MAG: hypothetical protein A3B88_01315 [Candidatus Zambryskibacteria bacterium RIFCSPHIGHO2_02_FULL_39_19]OHA99182.1 MAG: hypothetical protein A3F20_03265 [Candidatus Zambryskibacteria bacterium RIFCSPHIGHO2_12_FULL_39_21]OHB01944.1 MAG: hypothetical protein A3A96_00695 [Candidat